MSLAASTAVDIPCTNANFGTEEPEAARDPFEMDAEAISEIFKRKNVEALLDLGGVAGVAKTLEADLKNGIPTESVALRQQQFGENVLQKKDPVGFWEFLADAFRDPMIEMLTVAAAASIILGMTLPDSNTGEVERSTGWIEGTAIIISILVVTLTSSINNYQKAKKFEELEKEQSIFPLQVVRDGKEITVTNRDLVVGDVLVTEGGIVLDCDCLLIEGREFRCNEATMTGETGTVDKSADKDPFFISGTLLEEGSGSMLVVAVGSLSFQGRLQTPDEEGSETPLQIKLGDLANSIAKFGFAVAFLLVAALTVKEVVYITTKGREFHIIAFLHFVILAITIVVVAIPEGLPLAVTISLAFSMKQMMEENCLVRVLASCETMGAATAICTDKTGTVTANTMTVVQGLICEEEFVLSGFGIVPRDPSVTVVPKDAVRLRTEPDNLAEFCSALACCSTAREQVIDGSPVWVGGNKTEQGLLHFVQALGSDYTKIRSRFSSETRRVYPFNSTKKQMSAIVSDPTSGKIMLYRKGAPEVVLASCNGFLGSAGTVHDLTPPQRAAIMNTVNYMAAQGNRMIAVAYEPNFSCWAFPEEEPTVDTVLLGVLGIQDPIRAEVPTAIESCEAAGVFVRMVTGDNLLTAKAIGSKCGLFHDGGWDVAMSGVEFMEMYENDKSKLLELLPRLRIVARSAPQDKQRLVALLQETGEVVAVTGDGTNDAPALKMANVGFAMNCGTDIAKRAADMTLLDNNFASIVNAIRWGRAVNDNVRRFLQYQLSINFAGCMITLIGALMSDRNKEPFTPVQLLWLNLIMDTLAALALATERPCDALLLRPPVFLQSPLVSRRMGSFIAVHAIFQMALILILLAWGHLWFDLVESPEICNRDFPTSFANVTDGNFLNGTDRTWLWCERQCTQDGGSLADLRYCQQGRTHSTIVFNTFIFFQIFNIFNARKLFGECNPLEGVWTRSKTFLRVLFLIVAVQVVAVETFGRFMSVTRLNWWQWLICIGLGSAEVVVGIFVRFLPIQERLPEHVVAKQAKEDALRKQLKDLGLLQSAASPTRTGTPVPCKDLSIRRGSSLRKVSPVTLTVQNL